jgi:hypothetical protein
MAKQRTRNPRLPEPSLEHLNRLTDDTGLFQHAKFTIPLRKEGYTADDNARALIVAAKHYALYRKPRTLQLLDKYLAFLLHACNDNGSMKNFMNNERTWLKNEPASEAFGRSIWAFGELLAQPPSQSYVPMAKERIDIALPLLEKQSPRGRACAILGMAGYLKRFPDADSLRDYIRTAGETFVSQYENNHQDDWLWFEDNLTYDSAMLPCALFSAGMILNENKFLNVARQTCEFLLANTFTGNHFSFIGCNGWFPRGGKKAQFDQQPIEAAGTILMLTEAFKATKDKKYLALQQKAFNWFLGENDLGIPLYDSKTKGCSDGLGAEGISLNQGAESTLSFLLGLLAMCEGSL